MRLDSDYIEDDMYRFWKHCMLETKEHNAHIVTSNKPLICPEANAEIEDMVITETFLNNLPL